MSSDEKVEIERQVDLGALEWPARDSLVSESESYHRAYQDMRRFSWKDAQEVLKIEEAILQRLGDAVDHEDINDRISDEEWEDLYSLDLGVASTVLALSAARCIPITSCNGGPGHLEGHPLTAFYCRPGRVPDLLEATAEAGCGLTNTWGGMLMVYANSVRDMVSFARALIARRRYLRKLNTSAARGTPRLAAGESNKVDDNQQLCLPGLDRPMAL